MPRKIAEDCILDFYFQILDNHDVQSMLIWRGSKLSADPSLIIGKKNTQTLHRKNVDFNMCKYVRSATCFSLASVVSTKTF